MGGRFTMPRSWCLFARSGLFGLRHRTLESTNTHWKPVCYCLEERMECWLLNAWHMKAVRTSD